MTGSGDDGNEMPHDPFDDSAIERLLAGDTAGSGDLASLSSFIDDARTAAEAVPPPSPALAAALATGILPIIAPAPQSWWRKSKMKLQGFLAGLGVAGKLALGAGVAAAATTAGGAAGVLPGPVQHAVASAVGAFTPFELPDGDHHDGGNVAAPGSSTTTTEGHESTPTTEHHERDGHETTPTTEHHETTPATDHHEMTPTTASHDGDGHETTPTTASHDGDRHETTPTTEHHDGGGDETTPTTEHHETTTTTAPHGPASFTSMGCVLNDNNTVTCTWTVTGRQDGDTFTIYRNSQYRGTTGESHFTHDPDAPCVGEYFVRLVHGDTVIAQSTTVTVSGCI